MGNVNGNAYALTVLSPIKDGLVGEISYGDEIKNRLQSWNTRINSPLAKVPQTYLGRLFVLDDVFTQSLPTAGFFDTLFDIFPVVPDFIRRWILPAEDHLKSKYLVLSCEVHGDPEAYLRGMWEAISDDIKSVWGYCYAFDQVHDADSFVAYIKKCQMKASLFFVGSTDEPLEEQLKSLYLKQEFAKFAVDHQGLPAAQLQQAYQAFIKRVQPDNLAGPAWAPGQYTL